MKKMFSRSFDEIRNIVAMTDAFFESHGIEPDKRYVVDLCIEELFVNMVTYDTETDADIKIEMATAGAGIEVSITDFGVDRFDPREAPAVNIEAPLEERSPNGLGLFLVLKMVDSIRYDYRNRNSTITFIAGSE